MKNQGKEQAPGTTTEDISKAVEVAVAKALEVQKAQLDAANGKIEEMMKAKEAQEIAAITEVVKGYSFITEEDREELIKSLTDSNAVGGSPVILMALEKAQKAVDAAVTNTKGSDEKEELSDTEIAKGATALGKTVMEIIKARKA